MNQTSSNEQVTSSTIVAIIVIVFAGCWVALAYYKGGSAKDVNDNNILLLHPIVSILLISLLYRVRHLIKVNSVINTLIMMIAIWLFISLLGVLMPFILGLGFAYFFRFLVNAMQDIPLPKGKRLEISRGHARGILTAVTLSGIVLLFLYIIPQVVEQSQGISSGLVRLYRQSIVPFVVGNEFRTVAVQPDAPNVIYLGTAHGIYRHRIGGGEPEDLTDKPLIGQPIQAIAAAVDRKYPLYVGTARGLYVFSPVRQERTPASHDSRSPTPDREQANLPMWKPVGGETFVGKSVQAIAVPPWEALQIYVGTDAGGYRSRDKGLTWKQIDFMLPTQLRSESPLRGPSIQNIAYSSEASKVIYVASDQGVYQSMDAGETWAPIQLEGLGDASIQALTVADFNGEEWLYVGTSKGLYRWRSEAGWRVEQIAGLLDNEQADAPPSISLLNSLSGKILYAGNGTALYRRANRNSEWEPAIQAGTGIRTKLEAFGGKELVNNVQDYLTTKLPILAQTGREFVAQLVGRFSSIAIGFGGFLTTAFFTLLVFIYASPSLSHYRQSFINLFPQENRDTIVRYVNEIDQNMQAFLKGQLTEMLFVSLLSIAAYTIIGVPFSLIIGLLAGLCNAIPNFGPFIGGAFAELSLLMGFAAGNYEAGGFLIRAVILLGAIFGIQAIDNSLISPRVMSKAVDVDPMLIMFSVIVGASVLGFWGAILAIPTIVVVKSVMKVSREIRSEMEPPAPLRDVS
ncbi:AI-2E family transporter [Candidatus Poribacteria bacterium]|nr:AI-2E family transporter [Candidatus Poribacteria bacterium]